MGKPLKIWYHGTDKAAAENIRSEGFRELTWFAEHLEDALEFGGSHIFEVAFPASWWSRFGWQMQVPDPIPPSEIVSYFILEKTEIYKNEALGKKVFDSQEDPPFAKGAK